MKQVECIIAMKPGCRLQGFIFKDLHLETLMSVCSMVRRTRFFLYPLTPHAFPESLFPKKICQPVFPKVCFNFFFKISFIPQTSQLGSAPLQLSKSSAINFDMPCLISNTPFSIMFYIGSFKPGSL